MSENKDLKNKIICGIIVTLTSYLKCIGYGVVVAFVIALAFGVLYLVYDLLSIMFNANPLYSIIIFVGLPLIGFIGKKSIDFWVKKI